MRRTFSLLSLLALILAPIGAAIAQGVPWLPVIGQSAVTGAGTLQQPLAVPSGQTITIASGGTLTCASGATCNTGGAAGPYLPLAGGTMSGNIGLGANAINGSTFDIANAAAGAYRSAGGYYSIGTGLGGDISFYRISAGVGGIGTGGPSGAGALTLGALTATTITGTTETLTAAAPTVASGQIGYGGTTAATSNCGSLASAIACVVINVAGTIHYIPYY